MAKKAAPKPAAKSTAKAAPAKAPAKEAKEAKKTLAKTAAADKGADKAKKKSKGHEEEATPPPAEGAVDLDELEEQEMASMSGGGGAGGGEDAEAATRDAATGSLKNFRHHPDMENFYRFIFENDLRFEALEIIEGLLNNAEARKKIRASKGTKVATS